MKDCLFCKIRDRIIPKKFIYEDKDVMVFPDIHPLRPIHLLIVPRRHIKDFLELQDDVLWAKIRKVAQEMIIKEKLEDRGYRFVINGGGAQIIDHLHVHILGPLSSTAKM
jgi:histidine triad (HIT) family protein